MLSDPQLRAQFNASLDSGSNDFDPSGSGGGCGGGGGGCGGGGGGFGGMSQNDLFEMLMRAQMGGGMGGMGGMGGGMPFGGMGGMGGFGGHGHGHGRR